MASENSDQKNQWLYVLIIACIVLIVIVLLAVLSRCGEPQREHRGGDCSSFVSQSKSQFYGNPITSQQIETGITGGLQQGFKSSFTSDYYSKDDENVKSINNKAYKAARASRIASNSEAVENISENCTPPELRGLPTSYNDVGWSFQDDNLEQIYFGSQKEELKRRKQAEAKKQAIESKKKKERIREIDDEIRKILAQGSDDGDVQTKRERVESKLRNIMDKLSRNSDRDISKHLDAITANLESVSSRLDQQEYKSNFVPAGTSFS